MDVRTVHLIVEGHVQGVFYRANTQEKGKELGLKGTVKNLHSGSVEIYATGADETLTELIEWCWEGPPYSKVTNVQVNRLPEVQNFTSFTVLY